MMIQRIIKYTAIGFAVGLAIYISTFILDMGKEFIDIINGTGDKLVTGTFEYQDVSSLDVSLGIGDLELKQEGTELIVEVNEILGYEATVKNGKLVIKSGSASWRSKKGSTMTITVPESVNLNEIKLDMGVGRTSIEGINGEKLDIDLGTGAFIGENIICDYCKIDAGVGSVDVGFKVDPEEYSVILDKGLGDVSINGKDYSESDWKKSGTDKKIDIDCGVGEVKVNIEK